MPSDVTHAMELEVMVSWLSPGKGAAPAGRLVGPALICASASLAGLVKVHLQFDLEIRALRKHSSGIQLIKTERLERDEPVD
jgi:hypothetical protein